ncbi:tight adherence protein B [Sulfitobacter brevis]|uniref:Tight adherence protein B n=1 Tax=Sulfitobacter brevis TaxID=74348 RepID=A0A1I1XV83_9RHOB|nr:type II secretion system F family protein [Sulfitobacter brevis]SFE11246.1 tight adherence protein B [Sulfitobacter brevis]
MDLFGTDIISILIGLAVLLVGGLALRLVFAPEASQEKAAAKRIKNLRGTSDQKTAEAMVLKKRQPITGRDLPFVGNLPLIVQRAGLEGKEPLLILITASIAMVLTVVLSLKLGFYFALPTGIVLACLGVRQVLMARHNKRVDALTQQLPDALDLMMRGLRVGHPVNATIANVGRTMADPIGAEFRILAQQVSHGDYLTDAFTDFAERVGREDVEYLAVSINIQHGTGGNLAEMLSTLSTVVRDRILMRRRVRAISSEGRISAYLLSSLPVVIYLATTITAPSYYADVSDDPLFKPIAFAIVALVVGNFLALRKLVSFQY